MNQKTHVLFLKLLFLHYILLLPAVKIIDMIFPSLFWVETHIYWKIHKIIHNAEFNTALTQTQQTNE